MGEPRLSDIALFDTDYQVRAPHVKQDSLTNCRAGALRYHRLEQELS
jgi:hypothetical protein